jgi:hypothetical protein
MALKFRFLLSSFSRSARRPATNFIPLPSQKTIFAHCKDLIAAAECSLPYVSKIDEKISLFIDLNKRPPDSVVLVAIDAVAMNPDRSYLPSKGADYGFVIDGQPLDRRDRCFLPHAILSSKG